MKSKTKLFCSVFLCCFVLFYLIIVGPIPNLEVSVVGWGYNTTRDTSQYILSNNLSAHILPAHFCDSDSFLMLMVCSAPANFDARSAVRETWGHFRQVLGKNVTAYFLLGETTDKILQAQVLQESEKYGDVIVERFIDSYNNLTLKSIVMLKLVTTHCANTTKYVLKIDDDMFVNTEMFVQLLTNRNSTTDLLMGKLICRARPIKDTNSKWYSPSYMYSGSVYPNYLSGTGYLMSVDVAEKLYQATLKTPIFHLEDVYVTGICAKQANIKPHTNPLFTYQKITYDMCLIRKLLTAHRFTPDDIRKTYAMLREPGLSEECSIQKNNFNVNHWLFNNILKVNKTYRKSKCE